MAGVTSGSFNTSGYDGRYLKFSWSIKSQDIANNKTIISWTLKGAGGSSDYYYAAGNFKVVIDGVTVYSKGSNDRINLYNGTTVASGTATLSHDNEGKKSFSASAQAGIYYFAVNCTGNGSWTLPDIPRQAQITGADNFNDEQNPSITYNNPAGSSVTSLQACISLTGGTDDVKYRDIPTTGTTYTFELTSAERQVLRKASTSNSLNVIFFVRTVIGGNTFYSTLTKVMTIVNATPTFTNFSYKDTNSSVVAVTGSNSYLVKGLSNLQVTISSGNKMIANKEATANNYGISIDDIYKNVNYSTSDIVCNLGVVNSSGTKRLTVRAYDSRTNSTAVDKDIAVYDYDKPVINATVTRLNNFEAQTTLKVAGTYSKLSIAGSDKNTIQSVQYRYRIAGGTWSGWNTLTTSASGGRFSCNDVIVSLDNTKAFEFEILATDKLSNNNASLPLDIGQAIFFISTNQQTCYINGQEIFTYDVIKEW